MHRLMLLVALVASFVVASTASANQAARPARPEMNGGRQGSASGSPAEPAICRRSGQPQGRPDPAGDRLGIR